jgi:hypothetical protein
MIFRQIIKKLLTMVTGMSMLIHDSWKMAFAGHINLSGNNTTLVQNHKIIYLDISYPIRCHKILYLLKFSQSTIPHELSIPVYNNRVAYDPFSIHGPGTKNQTWR